MGVAIPPAKRAKSEVFGRLVLAKLFRTLISKRSGMLGSRPCMHPDRDHRRFPRTWRDTTRWWYVHRIVAALVVRYGVAYATVYTVKHNVSLPGGADIVGGAVAGGFASYVAAVPRAVWEAGHPSLIIGRTVRLHATRRTPRIVHPFGRSIRLPGRRRENLEEVGARQYVYDVALESAELVDAAPREHEIPRDDDSNIIYERNPAKVKLRDVQAGVPTPAKRKFSGCEGGCSGINWYCIDNPKCFQNK
jgi:hypothetical protein